VPNISYVNGRYVPHRLASVHVEDRGYQFADGVYEVIAVRGGHLVDEKPHLVRLSKSLEALRIDAPVTDATLRFIIREVLRRNRIRNGSVYLQITRGAAPRNHAFPEHPDSALVVTARHMTWQPPAHALKGVSVITLPDIRWKKSHIKSVSLLPNVLAKQKAVDAGAAEAWLMDDDGMVTEGTASNAWIVTKDNELVTRQLDEEILGGITRQTLGGLAEELQIRLVERPFSVEEAKAAREAFFTSSTSLIKPVVDIDGTQIGDGEVGDITRRLCLAYDAYMNRAPEMASAGTERGQ